MGNIINLEEYMLNKIAAGLIEQVKTAMLRPLTYDDLRCREQCKILSASLSILNITRKLNHGEVSAINLHKLKSKANEIIHHNENLCELFRDMINKYGNPLAPGGGD